MINLLRVRTLLFVLLTSCSASGSFNSCSEQPQSPFVPSTTNIVKNSIIGAISQQGINFIRDNREVIVGLALNVDEQGWASVTLPPIEAVEGDLVAKTKNLIIGLNIRDAEIALDVLGNPLRLDLSLKNAKLRIEQGSVEIQVSGKTGICTMSNGLDAGSVTESVTSIGVRMMISPQITVDGRIDASVTVDPDSLQIGQPSIKFESDASEPVCRQGGCDFVCDTTDLLAQLVESLYERLKDNLGETLAPILEDSIRNNLDELASDNLKVDGQIALNSQSIFPPDGLPISYSIVPSPNSLSFAGMGQSAGISLSLDLGSDSPSHPCVPSTEQDRLFSPGPPPDLGELAPPGEIHHLGVMVSEASINRLLWTVWRSGLLCLHLDTNKLFELTERSVDTSTLGIFFPSLNVLSSQPNPIMVAVNPQLRADQFPIIRYVDDGSGFPNRVGARIDLSNVGIDIYAQIEGQWSRLVGVSTSLILNLALQVIDEQKVEINIDPPQLDSIQVSYTELLEADKVPELLEVVLDLAVSGLAESNLSFDFSLGGLLSMATNTPYDLAISQLGLGGTLKDYLNISLRIKEQNSGMALKARLKTQAALVDYHDDTVVLDVESQGALNPAFQWRLGQGPWRRLRRTKNGHLVIQEPQFRLDIPHELFVRSVDLSGTYESDDDEFNLHIPKLSHRIRNPAIKPVDDRSQIKSGCNALGGVYSHPSISLILGLIFLPFFRRRRPRASKTALITMLLLSGCDNNDSSMEIPCTLDRDCPTHYACVNQLCDISRPCSHDGDCCGSQICQDGVCERLPTDGCTLSSVPCGPNEVCTNDTCLAQQCESDMDCSGGAVCVEGACLSGLVCDGECDADEACWINRNRCRKSPDSCPNTCPDGTVKVIKNPNDYDDIQCQPQRLECECIDVLPVSTRTVVRELDISLYNDTLVAVSYDPRFGDLIYMDDVVHQPQSKLVLDGFEGSIGADNQPDGTRKGQIDPGPDRGRHPQVRHDSQGRVHIGYVDTDNGDVRYLRRSKEGIWTQPIIVDSMDYAGEGLRLEIDQNDVLHMVYTTHTNNADTDGVHYAVAPATASSATDFIRLRVSPLLQQTTPSEGSLSLPQRYGQRPCLTAKPDNVVIGFHDNLEGKFYLASGNASGFSVTNVDGEISVQSMTSNDIRYKDLSAHDLGDHCSIAHDGDYVVGVVTDRQTWSLLSFKKLGTEPAVFDLVDSGGVGQRRLVGDGPVIRVVSANRYVTVYQDGTHNDLRLNVFDGTRWNPVPQVLLSNGAVGFSNALEMNDSRLFVATVQASTTSGGRETSDVRILDIPKDELR